MIFEVFLLIHFTLLAFLIFMNYRNSKVSEYRKELLTIILEQGQLDISRNRKSSWRMDTFDTVSYGQMLFQFWKPLDSFYKDKSFLGPTILEKTTVFCEDYTCDGVVHLSSMECRGRSNA